jgi:hypothetical protein
MICRRHHLDAVGAVLIREMRIEAKAGIVPVAGVDVAGGIAALGGAKKLAVGGGGRSVAPYRCDRQGVMRIDDLGECGFIPNPAVEGCENRRICSNAMT